MEIESKFSSAGGYWQEFLIGDIFKRISLNKINPLDSREFRVHVRDELHPIPGIVAKAGNNGVMYYVGRFDYETVKNKLVVIGNGAVASGLVYYHPYDFTVLHDAYAIGLKDASFERRGVYLYLQASLQKVIFKSFGYENKPTWNKINQRKIVLPCLSGKIAFEYMERFIQELQASRLQELQAYLSLTNLVEVHLTADEEQALQQLAEGLTWRVFNVKALFGAATRGKRLKGADRTTGDLPFVTAGETDTGISAFIGNSVERFPANTVTIDMFGSAKYRNYVYGADDHVAVVHTQALPKHAVLFAAAAMHKVANAGQFSYSRNFYAKDADALEILLPEKDGSPDWDLMARIARAVEKQVVADVVAYSEREAAAYEQVVQRH